MRKRKPVKLKYAYGTDIAPGEVPAPDLRVVRLSETLAVWVRLKLRLADGCTVLGLGPRGKRKVGRYTAGPRSQFAEFVDAFQGGKTRRRVPRRPGRASHRPRLLPSNTRT